MLNYKKIFLGIIVILIGFVIVNGILMYNIGYDLEGTHQGIKDTQKSISVIQTDLDEILDDMDQIKLNQVEILDILCKYDKC